LVDDFELPDEEGPAVEFPPYADVDAGAIGDRSDGSLTGGGKPRFILIRGRVEAISQSSPR
jgi:hypothetical protein